MLIRSTSEGADPNDHEEIECDGAFVAIGHEPNTKLFNGQLVTLTLTLTLNLIPTLTLTLTLTLIPTLTLALTLTLTPSFSTGSS